MIYFDSFAVVGYPISKPCTTMACSFDEHLARGSQGGVDYAVGVGNPIPAPTRGRVSNSSNASAGLFINFYHVGDDGNETGFYDQFMHLSHHGPNGVIVGPGEMIPGALSGNTGSSTGPHIHWDLRNPQGRVVRQWEYFTNESRRKRMFLINNGKAEYVAGQEYLHHVSGPAEESALKAVLGDVIWKGGAEFDNILKGLGIPLDKVAQVAGGKTWSRIGDVETLVKQGGGGGGATPAQIAKAVNDDVAKRMAS